MFSKGWIRVFFSSRRSDQVFSGRSHPDPGRIHPDFDCKSTLPASLSRLHIVPGIIITYNPTLHYMCNLTVCPRSSDPFCVARILYEMGHCFLDTSIQKVKVFRVA